MDYTVDDYNVNIKRGHVREDGMVLWGIRKYNGERLLDWRTEKQYIKSVKKKKEASAKVRMRHKAKLNDLKLAEGCEVCGFGTHKFPKKYREHNAMLLEFDHIDPLTKQYNVCDMGGFSWDMIQKEVDKCRVLCKKCHVEHTATQNRKEL